MYSLGTVHCGQTAVRVMLALVVSTALATHAFAQRGVPRDRALTEAPSTSRHDASARGASYAAASRAGAQEPKGSTDRCGKKIPASEARAYVGLPTGDVFCPLIADPKQLRSFLSYLRESDRDSTTTIGSVGIGDSFGLGRWGGSTLGNGVQLSLEGAVFAQFDLLSPSFDLLNADYLVGLPLTISNGRFSTRLRIYHQSSHLGDEYLLRSGTPERENLSFESAEVLLSLEGGALRVYGGGEYLFNRSPDDLDQYVGHGGLELRPKGAIITFGDVGQLRLIAATDVKAANQQDWKPAISARVGLEIDRSRSSDPPARRWSIMFESYAGPSPYGQFFRRNVKYVGLGASFNL